ncbi:hypothetical protein C1645_731161 [Glomus cerebriforme]|uniref:F-box domain-containing protein n=1 Tax=Glomus cerebriforme TaxID=658196 RepID=A0A397TWB0_9GLOM|nr:hypothetical protein C1645_731161 [Glomus cerebriforme]
MEFLFGGIVQGNYTVKKYYSKLKEYNLSKDYPEWLLKNLFLRGLSPENTFKVLLDGLEVLALYEIVERLDQVEGGGFSDKTLNRIAKSYSNLKYLNLRKRYGDDGLITDKGLYAIANLCQKLEYLNISHCKEFSEIAIWNVIHSCPRIKQLDIYECKITYKTIKEIGLYLKLKYFNLGTIIRYLEKIGQGQTVLGKDCPDIVSLPASPEH